MSSKPINWFVDQRRIWIAECLRIYGFINRDHIKKKFAISTPQASADLQYFVSNGIIEYNRELKRYEATR